MYRSLDRSWLAVLILAAGNVAEPPSAQAARTFDPAREPMGIRHVSNGFGQLLPARVPVPDAQGLPTAVVVDIRGPAELANVRFTNPILPPASWPSTAVLP